MEQRMKNIDDFFKEELGNYAELPPPPAWGALEKRLDEEKKRRVFPYRWFWFVSVIALLGITGLSVAWKMSASRELLAGGAVPTEKMFPAVASKPGNTNTAVINHEENTSANNSLSSITKTSPKTRNHTTAATHKKHSSRHMVLASHAPRMSKHKEAVLNNITETKETKLAATEAEGSFSQYTDEDYYEGATASIAPTPAELSVPAGYTINKRKKNNMLVADMTPKEEPAAHAYAAAPTVTPPNHSESTPATAGKNETHKEVTSVRSMAQRRKTATKATTISNESKAETAIAAKARAKQTAAAAKQTSRTHKTTVAKVQKTVVAASAIAAIKPAQPVKENKTAATAVAAAPKPTIAAPIKNQEKALVAKTTPATSQAMAPKAQGTQVPAKASTISKTEPTQIAAASTKTTAASMPVKKTAQQVAKTVNKKATEPTAIDPAVTTALAPKTTEPVTASAKTTAPATTKAATKAKPAKAPVAIAAAKPRISETSADAIKAEQATKKPETAALKASAPKATHGRKAAATSAKNEKAATAVAAIASTQPAKKAAEVPRDKTATASAKPEPAIETGILTAKENGKQIAKAAKTPAAKGQSKATGKPAINNFASAAKISRAPAASKASGPAKAGKIPQMTEDEMPTEDPTAGTTATSNTLAAGKQDEPLPGTFKEKSRIPGQLPIVQKEDEKPQVDSVPLATQRKRLEYGIKGGFEGSIAGDASRKLVISPYLDYKFSNKFSLLIQPALKASNLQTHKLPGTQTFYHVTGSDSTMTSSTPVLIITPTGNLDTMYMTNMYTYKQTHDSIVKSYNVGGTYFEFELPLLLKYAVTPKLAIYAGVNINYSRAMRVNEHTYTSSPIVRIDSSVTTFTPKGQPSVTPPSVSSVFTTPAGAPIGTYAGSIYPTSSESMLRLGYMLGFSYEFRKRWLFDALVQQGFAKSNVVGGFDINKPLTLPYVRLTLGYRLSK